MLFVTVRCMLLTLYCGSTGSPCFSASGCLLLETYAVYQMGDVFMPAYNTWQLVNCPGTGPVNVH